MQGYNELRESAAWLDLSERGKIRVTGEDRVRLLHAMCTNNIEQLKPGDGCHAFFLNAQGRILADTYVMCFEDHLLLDTEPETRQRVLDHLDNFIIADDATLEDVTSSLSTIAISGPKAAAPVGPPAALRIHTDTWHVFVPVTEKDAFLASLGIPQADAEAARTVRIERGRPRYGEEITERYLVQETGEMDAISFTKGCYLGQEIVERVRSRGQVHRHLKPLLIDSTQLPPAGTKLTSDGRELGEIASAVWSPALSQVVALAYLRTEAAIPGFRLDINGSVATVAAPADR